MVADEGFERGLEAVDGVARAVDVGPDSGPAGLVAEAAEPMAHKREGQVPGHEPGDEQDRHSVAARHPLSSENRVAAERGPFEGDPCLLPNGNPECVHQNTCASPPYRAVRTSNYLCLFATLIMKRCGRPVSTVGCATARRS